MKDNTNQSTEQPNAISTLLAASGPHNISIEEEICDKLSYLPTVQSINGVALVAYDSVVQIVHEAFKAACASGAVAKGVSAEGKSKSKGIPSHWPVRADENDD